MIQSPLFRELGAAALMMDIVKSSMKNRSGTYGKTRKTLPPKGRGEIIFDNTLMMAEEVFR
jgi:hypothetical protein